MIVRETFYRGTLSDFIEQQTVLRFRFSHVSVIFMSLKWRTKERETVTGDGLMTNQLDTH